MLRRIVDYAIESNEGHVRHAMSDGSHDYGARPGGPIGDLMTDGREAIAYFKENRDRIERLMDLADRWGTAFERSWFGGMLAKLMGVRPKA